MNGLFDLTLLIITAVGALGCLVFTATYWVKSGGTWLKTEAGKFLMVVYLNLGALFLLVIANQIFDDWPGRRPVTLVLFIAYVIESWWPLRLLFRYSSKEVSS